MDENHAGENNKFGKGLSLADAGSVNGELSGAVEPKRRIQPVVIKGRDGAGTTLDRL